MVAEDCESYMSAQTYLDRMLDPISRCLTPEIATRLTELSMDQELQDRIDELADKNTEGELTDEERLELETYIRTGNIISILLAKARKQLRQPEAA